MQFFISSITRLMTIDQQWITSPLLFYIIPTYFLVEGSSVGRQLSNNLRKLIFASWRRVQSLSRNGENLDTTSWGWFEWSEKYLLTLQEYFFLAVRVCFLGFHFHTLRLLARVCCPLTNSPCHCAFLINNSAKEETEDEEI